MLTERNLALMSHLYRLKQVLRKLKCGGRIIRHHGVLIIKKEDIPNDLSRRSAMSILDIWNKLVKNEDKLYRRVIKYAEDEGGISILTLKRKFHMNYCEAAMIMERMEKEGFLGPVMFNYDISENDENETELYEKVLKYAESQRNISISAIQREFSVGYNRAAGIMKRIEEDGYVD